MTAPSLILSAVNLSQPGTFLHWSIFYVSEANLVLIAVMVVIFGAALLLPFPKGRHATTPPPAPSLDGPGASADGRDGSGDLRSPSLLGTPPVDGMLDPADAGMWTARVRRRALGILPPGKLLPDRQPAYVASWVYVFGVGSLTALGVAIVSGVAIALGGVDWWHYNVVGHFFNSLHLWSVELFMALIVIHLWGKFWMAAWRGRRALTWMTGVLAFLAAVVECFTGYLSQQNFDAQWISTNGKDAINATGLGAFFNLMNFGQMLLWHVVLIPVVLIALVGAHVLLVRMRGVSHPLPSSWPRGRAARRLQKARDRAEWRGPMRRYDIVKEATAAGLVVTAVCFVLAGVLSSPDVPPVTIQTWAKVAPSDFLGTAANELAGTSETATYGPPYGAYSSSSTNVQTILFSPQRLAGTMLPVDAASAFVLDPLSKVAGAQPTLSTALARYEGASGDQQAKWVTAYVDALPKVTFDASGRPLVPTAAAGPVPQLLASELSIAESGGLDADLLARQPFYGTNLTLPSLFLEDGSYFGTLAKAAHLTGSQWGVMNETGSYPGQPWLWLYTLWYQLPGFRTSANVDLIAIYLTGIATLLLLAVPLIPGLRDVPRLVPVHRLVWRRWGDYETRHGTDAPAPPTTPTDPSPPTAPATTPAGGP
jgi:hypothetical protein